MTTNHPRYEAAFRQFKTAEEANKMTKQNLDEATAQLEKAQALFNSALSKYNDAESALSKAQDELNELDLRLPGQWNTMYNKLVAFQKNMDIARFHKMPVLVKRRKLHKSGRNLQPQMLIIKMILIL